MNEDRKKQADELWREFNEKREQYELYMKLGDSCSNEDKKHDYYLTARKFYTESLVLRKQAKELYNLPFPEVQPPKGQQIPFKQAK